MSGRWASVYAWHVSKHYKEPDLVLFPEPPRASLCRLEVPSCKVSKLHDGHVQRQAT